MWAPSPHAYSYGASHGWGSYPFARDMPSPLPWWKRLEAKGEPTARICGKSSSLQGTNSILQQFFDIFGENANKMSIA